MIKKKVRCINRNVLVGDMIYVDSRRTPQEQLLLNHKPTKLDWRSTGPYKVLSNEGHTLRVEMEGEPVKISSDRVRPAPRVLKIPTGNGMAPEQAEKEETPNKENNNSDEDAASSENGGAGSASKSNPTVFKNLSAKGAAPEAKEDEEVEDLSNRVEVPRILVNHENMEEGKDSEAQPNAVSIKGNEAKERIEAISSRLRSRCTKPATGPNIPSARDDKDLPSDPRSFLEKYEIRGAKIEEKNGMVFTNYLVRDRNRRSRRRGSWYRDGELPTKVLNTFWITRASTLDRHQARIEQVAKKRKLKVTGKLNYPHTSCRAQVKKTHHPVVKYHFEIKAFGRFWL